MARHERHFGKLGHVPSTHNDATRIGLGPQQTYSLGHLVDMPAISRYPVAPLLAVDRTQVPLGVGPFVPNTDARFLQAAHIRLATQEPEQFMDDAARVHLLGGDQRETFREVKTHLPTKHAERAGAGAIFLALAVVTDVPHQVQILAHWVSSANHAVAAGFAAGVRHQQHARTAQHHRQGEHLPHRQPLERQIA